MSLHRRQVAGRLGVPRLSLHDLGHALGNARLPGPRIACDFLGPNSLGGRTRRQRCQYQKEASGDQESLLPAQYQSVHLRAAEMIIQPNARRQTARYNRWNGWHGSKFLNLYKTFLNPSLNGTGVDWLLGAGCQNNEGADRQGGSHGCRWSWYYTTIAHKEKFFGRL